MYTLAVLQMYTVEAIILGGTFWNEDTNSVKT